MAANIWITSDLVLLIAWLEFCRQNGIDFETTIIKLLRESRKRQTGRGYPFTWKQVKDKLIDLARKDKDPKRSVKDYARLDEILLKGSACFPHLARELQPQIDVAVERFHESHAHSEPQKTSRTNQEPSERNEREALETPKLFPNLISSNRGLNSTNGRSLRLHTVVSNGPLCSEASINMNATTPSKSQPRIDIRRRCSPRGGGWQRSQSIDIHHDAVRRVERLWEEDTVSLHGQIAILEKEKRKLLAMLQNSDNARQHRESFGQDPKESQFRLYHHTIWELQQLNMDLESAANFFDLDASESRSLQVEVIDESMDQIQSELESILGNCDTTNLQLSTAIDHGSDLEALLLSCLNLPNTPEHLELRLKECISHFEAPILMRALVLAALNDWVFNTPFPPFMEEGGASLFLRSIEEIALEHRDWAWLRNLQTAAYSRFLASSEFKEGLLPIRSRLLADRLSNAAAFLIIPVSSESGHAGGPKVVDPILETLHSRFNSLFFAGLRFKATTAATDNRYEFALEPLGTMTLEMTQGPAPMRTFTTHDRGLRGDTSRSWFHASLRVYDAGPANWLNPRSNAIIQTDNFVPGLSKTNCNCIYKKDITVKISDIRHGGSEMQNIGASRNLKRSRRESLESPSTLRPDTAGLGPSSCGRTDYAQDQRVCKSAGYIFSRSIDDRLEQNTTDFLSAKRISVSEYRRDEDNDSGSVSDLTSIGDPYEPNPDMTRAEVEAMRSERTVPAQRAPGTRTAGDGYVCPACGTSLSNLDSLRRHQRNGSCRRCKICARKFPSNEVLRKHQKSDHPTGATIQKRQRLGQDVSFRNIENAEPDNRYVCENCNEEFNQISNLQRHLRNKSCSKCFRCGKEFATADEFHSHMRISHSLQFIESRWRRLDLGERVREPLEPPKIPNSTTSEDKGNVVTHNESIHVVDSNRQSSPPSLGDNKHHCSTCDGTFSSQYALDRHKGRQRHRLRVRELEKASAIQQQGTLSNHPKSHPAKGLLQDRTFKGRVEKQRHPRASTEMRREPTPESRHINRIMATLAKVNELENSPTTRSTESDQQQTETTASTFQHTEATHAVSETAGIDGGARIGESAQAPKVPANFGGQFSAPPRTFENVAAAPSSCTKSVM